MITKLNHISTIQTGVFAQTSHKGEAVYLKSTHFDENGQLVKTLFPDLSLDNVTEKHLLKPDDILFSAKGTKNFATLYEAKNEPAVASTSFFVIRLNSKSEILPQYLVWILNNPSIQKLLKDRAIGSNIVSISKKVLEDLEIPVPAIKVQQAVLKIDQLRKTENELKNKIEILRENQIQQQILNGINQ